MRNNKRVDMSIEYRKKAQEHMDAFVISWKTFLNAGVYTIAAACVLVGICLAWFASNKEVNSSGMHVQGMPEDAFELAAAGNLNNKGTWDQEFLSEVPEGDVICVNETSYVSSSAGKSSIRWAITEDSHMENGMEQPKGLRPGSSGKMVFYIIAKNEGPLTVTLNIAMRGTTTDVGETLPEDALDILQGHILLFAGYNAENSSYSGFISQDALPWEMQLVYEENSTNERAYARLQRTEEGSLVWTADEVVAGCAYPVTIYWIWPEVFGQYIFKTIFDTENRPVLFPENQFPVELFSAMCDAGTEADVNKLSNRYFRWNSPIQKEEFKNDITVDNLKDLRDNPYDQVYYGKVCEYYNQADQFLGESVRYLELRIDAK